MGDLIAVLPLHPHFYADRISLSQTVSPFDFLGGIGGIGGIGGSIPRYVHRLLASDTRPKTLLDRRYPAV